MVREHLRQVVFPQGVSRELLSGFNLGMPIDIREIEGFRHWVNVNGCTFSHCGYDFAAYLTQDGRVTLGLPAETQIKAVADGIAYVVFDFPSHRYDNVMYIKHEESKYGGLTSTYGHIVPSIEEGVKVNKGDVIGILYKGPGNDCGPLVHLHFELRCNWQRTVIDPRVLDESLYAYNMTPAASPKFDIPELPGRTEFVVAHFKRVNVGVDDNSMFKSRKRLR